MASPMYRQIAEDLRVQIESGKLKPGQQLRTELELRDYYGASRNTVRDAVKWLTAIGLVDTKPGQGTFVAQKTEPFFMVLTSNAEAPDLLRNSAKKPDSEDTLSDPQVEIQKANYTIAHLLQVDEGAQAVSRRQKRSIGGTPSAIQTSYYPMDFAQRGASQILQAEAFKGGSLDYLAETLGLKIGGYRDWIAVRTPDASETLFFGLPQDGRVEVFEVYRTAYDGNGKPMLLTVTVFPTDRNQLVVDVDNVPDDATLPQIEIKPDNS